MKKLISLILILCMACMLVPAMAEDDILGDWYLVQLNVGEATVNPASLGMNMTYTLKDGGVLEVTGEMMGETNSQTGTWTQDGSTITMTIEGQAQTATYADGKIMIESDGQTGILSKEAPVVSERAKTVAADSEEAFFGEWTLAGMDMMGMTVDKEQFEAFGLTGYEATMTVEAGKVHTVIAMGESTGEQVADYPSKFEDGKLLLTVEVPEDQAKMMESLGLTLPEFYTIELLEDGSLVFSMEMMGMQIGLYMVKSDTAAEQPAA
jgi:hypothetical protein